MKTLVHRVEQQHRFELESYPEARKLARKLDRYPTYDTSDVGESLVARDILHHSYQRHHLMPAAIVIMLPMCCISWRAS